MSWVAVGAAAIGAVTAAQQRKAQQQANQQSSDVNAAQTQFSPWTGIKPQAFAPQAVTANALGGAVQGGLGGAMFAQGQKKSDAELSNLNAQTKMMQQQSPLDFDKNKYRYGGHDFSINGERPGQLQPLNADYDEMMRRKGIS